MKCSAYKSAFGPAVKYSSQPEESIRTGRTLEPVVAVTLVFFPIQTLRYATKLRDVPGTPDGDAVVKGIDLELFARPHGERFAYALADDNLKFGRKFNEAYGNLALKPRGSLLLPPSICQSESEIQGFASLDRMLVPA